MPDPEDNRRMTAPAEIAATLAAVRSRRPLVHNITSAVVANLTANALLALGASPAMAESADEVEALAGRADALVINLGVLSPERAAAMRLAAAAARDRGRPWALDPVGAGAIGSRAQAADALLRLGPAALRGNASEVLSLAGAGAGGRGVDALAGSGAAVEAARALAARTGAVVAVTGATDYVTDGARVVAVRNGHSLMAAVTGLGCAATAIIGACLAVEPDRLAAAAHGLALIGVAGELAAERCRGPGSLAVELLDALHGLDAGALGARARVEG